MPKSRHPAKRGKCQDKRRLQERFDRAMQDLVYAKHLLGLLDDALKGANMEATYVPEPVPHITLTVHSAQETQPQEEDRDNADPEAAVCGS